MLLKNSFYFACHLLAIHSFLRLITHSSVHSFIHSFIQNSQVLDYELAVTWPCLSKETIFLFSLQISYPFIKYISMIIHERLFSLLMNLHYWVILKQQKKSTTHHWWSGFFWPVMNVIFMVLYEPF